MALLGNAKPTSEELERLRAEKGKGRVWVYQNTKVGTPDAGKLLYLAKPYAPPAQVADPNDGTLWRYVLVGYIPDLKTGEIWECSMGPRKPQDPRLTRKVIPGPWGKRIIEPPREDGRGGNTSMGYLPADHKVYTMGPVISGRPLYPPRKISTEE